VEYRQGKTEELGERPVPVLLCPSQIPHVLTRARNQASTVTGQLPVPRHGSLIVCQRFRSLKCSFLVDLVGIGFK
jgi:hypothetical protein